MTHDNIKGDFEMTIENVFVRYRIKGGHEMTKKIILAGIIKGDK